MPLITNLLTIVDLIRAGLTTTQQVVSQMQAGRVAVRDAAGAIVSPEDFAARIAEAQALAAQVGDEAVARVLSRVDGGGGD